MAGFSTTFANNLLKLFLNGTPIANLADNAASGPLTNLYLALHTAAPSDSGDQTASEAAYSGYSRVAVPRSTSGFTAAVGGTSALASSVDFPAAGGSGATITHWSVGTTASGAGVMIGSGELDVPLSITAGVIPRLTNGTTINVD